jgi:hypothetical protein
MVELTLRAGLQPQSPKATKAQPRRGGEFGAMIETRGAQPQITRWVSSPRPFARHLHEGREVFGNGHAAHCRRGARSAGA